MRERFEKWLQSLPRCLGYDGGCSGDLAGIEHEKDCPMKGKELATLWDAWQAATAGQQELIEALREAEGIIVWMSGYDDFAPEGKAGKGWNIARKKLNKIRAVLARYGKS